MTLKMCRFMKCTHACMMMLRHVRHGADPVDDRNDVICGNMSERIVERKDHQADLGAGVAGSTSA